MKAVFALVAIQALFAVAAPVAEPAAVAQLTEKMEKKQECLNPRSVLRELANLPRTLDATYGRIIQNIRSEHWTYATRLLQFLAYSERPLRLEETVDAVEVDVSCRPRFDPANRMPDQNEVVRYCSSLVVLVPQNDEESGTKVTEIQLAHLSVQEYLLSDRLDPTMAADFKTVTARAAIVEVCLFYLLDLDFSDDLEEARERYPLAQYSAQYWSTHAAAVGKSWNMVSQVVQEYISCREAFDFGNRLYRPYQPWKGLDKEREQVTALYYVSFTGLFYAVQWLLDKGADVSAQGGYYGNALYAASIEGHEKVIQLLLDRGADVNAQGGWYGNALYAASEEGHEKVVQLLLYKGADVNAQDKDSDSALYNASVRGHEKVVQLLLDKGADVNAQGGSYGNALQAASKKGHEKVVQLLLDKGANREPLFLSSTVTAADFAHESPNKNRRSDQLVLTQLPVKKMKIKAPDELY